MTDAESRWRRARQALAERRYAEAWPLHEARRELAWIDTPAVEAAYPEWRGEPLAGARLMVCAEQGFGDQLMFGRYLHRLRALGAQVAVACHPGFLGRLFRSQGYPIAPLHIDRPLPQADYWTLIGSLPYRLGAAAPLPAKYLDLPPAAGGGVGVMTRGNPAHVNDAARSLPDAFAAELLRHGRDLAPESTGARDFLDTAAVVAGLDLVVTVDTAVAHLAGAMGKATWLILPANGPEWRWNDGRRSDWYPDFRLWPHPADGGWPGLIEALAQRGS